MIRKRKMKIIEKNIEIKTNVSLEYFSVPVLTFEFKKRKALSHNNIILIEPNYKKLVHTKLYIYKLTFEGDDSGYFQKLVKEGIVVEDNLDSLKSCRPIDDKFWAVVEESELEKLVRPDNAGTAFYPEIIEEPFTYLKNGKGVLVQYHLGENGHIFNKIGVPFPQAMYFNYMSGKIDNAHYDLDRVIEILSKRTDIFNLIIKDIPYYNSQPGRDKQIEFVWVPTREDMITIWEYCRKAEDYVDSYRAIFELDLLGLRKAGAAKFDCRIY